MNLILLLPTDLISPTRAVIRDERRLTHCLRLHKGESGGQLRVGMVGGKVGTGTVISVSDDRVELEVTLNTPPPAPCPIGIILALPRPPMLKRSLQTIATLGVKQLLLLQSSRVEKSFWQSPQLRPEKIREELILGLEQGCDTILPEVTFAPRFRPFVEDDLDAFVGDRQRLIAHPYVSTPCPHAQVEPSVLVIGPEGGFRDKELKAFTDRGFTGVTLGPRIMRVETAIPYLLGRLSS